MSWNQEYKPGDIVYKMNANNLSQISKWNFGIVVSIKKKTIKTKKISNWESWDACDRRICVLWSKSSSFLLEEECDCNIISGCQI